MEDEQHKQHIQQALNRSYFFLKFRPRSHQEVANYLQKKSERYHWSRKVIEETLQHLQELDLINDQKFVEWFVEQRSAGKPKSAFALRHELSRYGINKDLLDKYFSENELNEEELALVALRRKWNSYRYLDKQERFQKAAAFLGRRGFTFATIKKVIAQLEESVS